MKKYLLILFVFIVGLSFSQNHYLGLQVGSNFSNIIYDSEVKFRQDALVSFSSGITYDYHLKNGFLLGSGLLFDRKGNNFDMTFTNETGKVVGSGKIKSKYNYLSLPLKFGYTIGNQWSAYAYLGFVPSYLLQAEHSFSADYEVPGFSNNDTEITDQVQRFELSGLFEIGCNYQLKERLHLFLNTSYLYAFTNIYEEADIRIVHHRLNVSVGVKYALKAGDL